jgi:glycosyltransferase involved in cell wall biosynthesis
VSTVVDRLEDRLNNRVPAAVVAINRRPVTTPWGGGNQWIDQIVRALRGQGYSVRFSLHPSVDCVLLIDPRSGPTASFDVAAIAAHKAKHPQLAVIQRVNDNDKHRGSDFRDALQAAANPVADYTVFLSEWLKGYETERWFDAGRPHGVIRNGADPRFFHPIGGAAWRDRSLRLVTHHWSREWNKGFDVYVELDRLIAEGQLPDVEFWVVGRWPETIRWRAARTFPPVREAELGSLLRQCHVYLTASRWESGPMHVVEAAQCGLPIIYHADGGAVREAVGAGGIEFRDDVSAAVAQARSRYLPLRATTLSMAPGGDRMCAEWRMVIQQVIQEKRIAHELSVS